MFLCFIYPHIFIYNNTMYLMTLMKNTLKVQDHFGEHIFLHFEGNRTFHTVIGQTISLLINGVCFAIFISMVIDLFQRNNPSVNNVKLNIGLGKNITINSEDFFLSVAMLDKNFVAINDPSIVVFDPIYSLQSVTPEGIIVKTSLLEITNCSNYRYLYTKFNLDSAFEEADLLHAYCVKGSALDNEIVLGGRFGTKFYGNLFFRFRKCQNSTDSDVICKPMSVIDERLDQAWLQARYINRYVDIYDYLAPIKHFSDSAFSQVDPKLGKMMYLYFNQINIYSDDGLIFNDVQHSSSFKTDYSTSDVNLISADNAFFGVFVISSFNMENSYRSYIKLQFMAANVGGILKILVVVGSVLLSSYNQMRMNERIINTMFEFTRKSPFQKKSLSTIFQSSMNKENILTFRLGLINFFKTGIYCKSKETKEILEVFNKIKNEVERYMDYLDIIQSLQEIMKLKMTLFDNNQYKIFETIGKFKWEISDNMIHEQYNSPFSKNKKYSEEELKASLVILKHDNSLVAKNILKSLNNNEKKEKRGMENNFFNTTGITGDIV